MHFESWCFDVGMSRETTRLPYLARHAEPEGDGAGLTSHGVRQAEHLGRRLAPLSVGRITHGPLPRAAETARVVAEQFEQSPSLSEDEAAGDYVPHLPGRDEVPDAWADAVLSFLADISEDEASTARISVPGRSTCSPVLRWEDGILSMSSLPTPSPLGGRCDTRWTPRLALVSPEPVPRRTDGNQVRVRRSTVDRGRQRRGPPAG